MQMEKLPLIGLIVHACKIAMSVTQLQQIYFIELSRNLEKIPISLESVPYMSVFVYSIGFANFIFIGLGKQLLAG